jgi:hypothetical protein
MPAQAARPPSMVVNSVTLAPRAEVRIERESTIAVRFLLNRVDDQHDLAVLDHVDDVRPALGHLVHHADRNAGRFDGAARAARGDQRKTQFACSSRATSTAFGRSAGLTLRKTLDPTSAGACRRPVAT